MYVAAEAAVPEKLALAPPATVVKQFMPEPSHTTILSPAANPTALPSRAAFDAEGSSDAEGSLATLKVRLTFWGPRGFSFIQENMVAVKATARIILEFFMIESSFHYHISSSSSSKD